jgi:ABC-type lipoprotein release transport system permease subunit
MLSVAGARLVSGLLYGVKAGDPLAFTVPAVILLCVGLAACAAPALSASRTNPMMVLRDE